MKSTNQHTKSFLELHLAVFLFGFTAIFGDIIELQVVSLVWWRVFFAVIIFFFIFKAGTILKDFTKSFILIQLGIGVLISFHWLAFYGSIKISNASMALIAMSTNSLITALIEPIIRKEAKLKRFDLIISILVIPPMLMIYFNSNEVQQLGLWIGLIASFLGSVFAILNKKYNIEKQEIKIAFMQIGSVWLILSLLIVVMGFFSSIEMEVPNGIDWFYLLIFAGICTVLAYILYLKSFRKLTAFDVSFAFNMEPVYGIIMAAVLLNDYNELSVKSYIGMVLILIIVYSHLSIKSKRKKNE